MHLLAGNCSLFLHSTMRWRYLYQKIAGIHNIHIHGSALDLCITLGK